MFEAKMPGAGGAEPHAAVPQNKSNRIVEIDGIRGYLVLMMYLAHLPSFYTSVFSYLHHSRYSAVYDGEFFVLLSGLVCAIAYNRDHRSGNKRLLWRKVLGRVGWLLVYQSLTIVAVISLFWFGLGADFHEGYNPVAGDFFESLLKGVSLVNPPPLLDILPLYIVLMLLIPSAFALLSAGRTGLFAGAVAAAWLLSSSGSDVALADWVRSRIFDWTAHVQLTGYFNPLSWCVLFYAGFYLGYRLKEGGARQFTSSVLPLHRGLFLLGVGVIAASAACSLLAFLGYAVPSWLLQPDRTKLSFVIITNTAAIAYCVYYILGKDELPRGLGQVRACLLGLFRSRLLVFMGQNSLFAYSVHIPIVFLVSYVLVRNGWAANQLAMAGLFLVGAAAIWALTLAKRRFFPHLP